MSDKVRFKLIAQTGKVGSRCEHVLVLDREDLYLDDGEVDEAAADEILRDHLGDVVDFWWEIVEPEGGR